MERSLNKQKVVVFNMLVEKNKWMPEVPLYERVLR